jgi:type VI protein secretion system component Hcp
MNLAVHSRVHRSKGLALGDQEGWHMNTDKNTQRETILLTDAELDAVVGGGVALHDIVIVKHVDKASSKLFELC